MAQKEIILEKDENRGYKFIFSTGEITTVTRAGNEITAHACTCGKNYCAHLAASLFFLQKNLLNETSINGRDNLLKQPDLFARYRTRIRKQRMEDSFSAELKRLLRQKDGFYFALAALCELSRQQGYEREVQEVLTKIRAVALRETLAAEKQDALQKALLLLLSPGYFRQGAYRIILPYALQNCKQISVIKEARSKLEKRKGSSQLITGIDEKEIALAHLRICEEKINGRKISSSEKTAAYFIALARNYLLRSNKIKAADVLKDGYQRLSKNRDLKITDYLEKSIALAAEAKDHALEAELIKEIFIRDLFIKPFFLERIKKIINKSDQRRFADELMEKIKNQSDSFDKHYHLLYSQKRFAEAMQLISGHKNKFRYANETVLQMKELNENTLDIYVKQFCLAILSAPETHFQKRIFQNALLFLNRLESEKRNEVMQRMLEGLPKHSYMYQQISAQLVVNLQA